MAVAPAWMTTGSDPSGCTVSTYRSVSRNMLRTHTATPPIGNSTPPTIRRVIATMPRHLGPLAFGTTTTAEVMSVSRSESIASPDDLRLELLELDVVDRARVF